MTAAPSAAPGAAAPIVRVWAASWRLLVFFLAWALLVAPALIPAIGPLRERLGPFVQIYAEAVTLTSALLAAAVMTRWVDRRPLGDLGFRRERALADTLVGLLIGVGAVGFAVAALWLGGYAEPIAGLLDPRRLGLAVAVTMLNAAAQEVLMRSYLQPMFAARLGRTAAVVLVAVLFALLHWGALRGAALPTLNVFLAGVWFGAAYALTGRLWLPIAIHVGWNALLGPVLGLTVSGRDIGAGWRLFELDGPALVSGGGFGLEGGLAATAAVVIAIAATAAYGRPRRGATIPAAP